MCRAVDLWAGSVSVHTSRAAVRPWGVVNRWCIVHTPTASGHPRARISRDPAAFPSLTAFISGRNASPCRRPATISPSCGSLPADVGEIGAPGASSGTTEALSPASGSVRTLFTVPTRDKIPSLASLTPQDAAVPFLSGSGPGFPAIVYFGALAGANTSFFPKRPSETVRPKPFKTLLPRAHSSFATLKHTDRRAR